MNGIKKILRYCSIYGLVWTMIKVAGRKRNLHYFFPKLLSKKSTKYVTLIGCGQFGFSTISYNLFKEQGDIFLECYDVEKYKQQSCAKFWNYREQDDLEKLISNPNCKLIYVASNHHSHTDYAISALLQGKDVHVEKPISVNYEQFQRLLSTKETAKGKFYVGYNRPFSKAIVQLRKFQPKNTPITLNCFVVGHKLEKEHWYRNPEEGTRVCGNIGHWLDLAIHLFAAREWVPDLFHITVAYSSEVERDDNVAVSITTDYKDLITIVLTAREEPFEGVNETINFQSANIIAKIDDFRNIQIWKGNTYKKFTYKLKDLGHLKTINQPFIREVRDFNEIIISTILMLELTDMVHKGEVQRTVHPKEILGNLMSSI